MNRSRAADEAGSSKAAAGSAHRVSELRWLAGGCALAMLLWPATTLAQVVTINTRTGAVTNGNGKTVEAVDRRFRQVQPTHIELSKTTLDEKTKLELVRFLEADQGFAMRPIPRGHKGLTLEANGLLDPAGEPYLDMVTAEGLCAKPGDRVVLSDIKIEHSKIILQIDGGPDAKHRFLRHIQLGTGPMMNPVVPDDGTDPTGARITLTFPHGVPELTGKQVESLLAPLISFEVMTPIEAFTETLPPKLKEAILSHQVLVGMSTDMVLFAKGRPENKIREMDGQMPIEIWMYGKPPETVDFVRINGNRVIRVEIAAVGKPLQVFTKNEVEGMMRTDGTPLNPAGASNTHTVEMGDVIRNPDTQAPAPPPTLRAPGEKIPDDTNKGDRTGVMRPVQFPKQTPDDQTGTTGSGQPGNASPSTQTQPGSSTSGSAQTPPGDASQQTPAKPAPDASQPQ